MHHNDQTWVAVPVCASTVVRVLCPQYGSSIYRIIRMIEVILFRGWGFALTTVSVMVLAFAASGPVYQPGLIHGNIVCPSNDRTGSEIHLSPTASSLG